MAAAGRPDRPTAPAPPAICASSSPGRDDQRGQPMHGGATARRPAGTRRRPARRESASSRRVRSASDARLPATSTMSALRPRTAKVPSGAISTTSCSTTGATNQGASTHRAVVHGLQLDTRMRSPGRVDRRASRRDHAGLGRTEEFEQHGPRVPLERAGEVRGQRRRRGYDDLQRRQTGRPIRVARAGEPGVLTSTRGSGTSASADAMSAG